MDRPTNSVARLTPAIVAALAALAYLLCAAAALAPTASAAAPADDEYVLEIPGVRQSPTDSAVESATGGGGESSHGPRQGVVGESAPPPSQLDALASALGSAPGAFVAGLAALLTIALLLPYGNRTATRGAR